MMTGIRAVIYRITDHLGSVRVIKDGEGTVLQRFDYYPFGSESRVWTAGTNTPQSALRYRFGGKEIAGQKVSVSTGAPAAAAGSPYLDFGARLYDPRTAVWLSQDPMAEKYYPISPFAYCAGNPINLVDPEGKKIYFAEGVSEQFKKQFAATIKYMNSRGTADNLAKLENSEEIYYISEVDKLRDVKFSSRDNNTIYWDPNHLLETTLGLWLSPATMLDHEATHALRHDNFVSGKMSQTEQIEFLHGTHSRTDKQYDTKEERYVITGREQITAFKHKEISKGQVTRTDHKLLQVGGSLLGISPEQIEQLIFSHNILFVDE